MPTIVVTQTESDGQVLFESDIDHLKESIEDFFNLTGIDEDNLKATIVARLLAPATVVMYAGLTPPDGWLVCDGTAVSRFTFAVLYGIVGDLYGNGDGISTFNLPDFQRQVPMGMGGTQIAGPDITVGSQGGDETVELEEASIPAHTHVTGGTHTHVEQAAANGGAINQILLGSSASATPVTTATTTANASSTLDSVGDGDGHNNVQPSLVVNFIIKY